MTHRSQHVAANTVTLQAKAICIAVERSIAGQTIIALSEHISHNGAV